MHDIHGPKRLMWTTKKQRCSSPPTDVCDSCSVAGQKTSSRLFLHESNHLVLPTSLQNSCAATLLLATFEHRFVKTEFRHKAGSQELHHCFVNGKADESFVTLDALVQAFMIEGFELDRHLEPGMALDGTVSFETSTSGCTSHWLSFKRQTS